VYSAIINFYFFGGKIMTFLGSLLVTNIMGFYLMFAENGGGGMVREVLKRKDRAQKKQ